MISNTDHQSQIPQKKRIPRSRLASTSSITGNSEKIYHDKFDHKLLTPNCIFPTGFVDKNKSNRLKDFVITSSITEKQKVSNGEVSYEICDVSNISTTPSTEQSVNIKLKNPWRKKSVDDIRNYDVKEIRNNVKNYFI